jgi:hypothetical protein
VDRVFEVLAGTVSIERLTVTGGQTDDGEDGEDRQGAPGTGAGTAPPTPTGRRRPTRASGRVLRRSR